MVDRTRLSEESYPFESHWLELGDSKRAPVRYHYLDEGPRDGRVVVMLHGNPTWSFYYRTLIPAISQSYRVIVPDHVGCGLSGKPQDYAYTLEQHAQNLEALIDHLGLRDITLVLHDWGGSIGMRYATQHPENVARFVVFNTTAFYVKGWLGAALPLRIKMCRWPLLGDLLLRGLNAFAGLALVWATAHPERITPQVKAGYLAPYDSWHNRIATLRFVQDIPLEKRHPTRQTLADIEAGLPLLAEHPMMIVWGERDFCFTARDFLPEWQRRFPQAQTHVVPDAGHYVVEDAHERIVPWMLAFLKDGR